MESSPIIVAGAGSISKRDARERAVRLSALAVATRARHAVGRVEHAIGRWRSPSPEDEAIA